jgi:hypothetical protein
VTPQEAADGLIELVLPERGRVLVDIRDRAAGDPDVEADVIRVMLDADGSHGDLCAAVDDYAEASGLAATYAFDADALIVAIGDPEVG